MVARHVRSGRGVNASGGMLLSAASPLISG